MPLEKRKSVLWALVTLFLIIGPAIVLYAYGWRWDFTRFRPVRVGGILLRGLPPEARIKIDNRLVENQDERFLGGTLIANLAPGKYFVRVEKDGYRPWEKKMIVEPETVAESRPLVLVPENSAEQRLLDIKILDFWVNGGRLAYQDKNKNYFLADTADPANRINLGILFNNLRERILKLPRALISSLETADNPNRWLIGSGKSWYVLDVKKLTLEPISKKPPKENIPLPQFALPEPEKIETISNYKDPDHLIIQYPGRVMLLEVDDREPLNLQLLAEGVKKHAYDGERLYLLRGAEITYFEL